MCNVATATNTCQVGLEENKIETQKKLEETASSVKTKTAEAVGMIESVAGIN